MKSLNMYVKHEKKYIHPLLCLSLSLQVRSESGAMVEVVDGWLAQLHPNKPTWREIADVVDSIGHHDLALSLRQVYVSGDTHGSFSISYIPQLVVTTTVTYCLFACSMTGSLPIQVSNALPESLMVREPTPPPPLPPRGTHDDQNPPPLPVKLFTSS